MATNINQGTSAQPSPRRAAVGGLAVVGFIALILIGIATAIYAASFLPKAFSHLSSANVYLSSLTQPNQNTGTLQPTTPDQNQTAPATSIPLSPATTSAPTYTPSYTPPATTPSTPAATTPKPTYKPTYTAPTYTYTQPTYTQPSYITVPSVPNYFGQPDLVTTITSVGYLTRYGDTSSYVNSSNVPSGYEGAVRFVIANRGSNVSGNWTFRADLPTNDSNDVYYSPSQRPLNPGDSVVFTLGFDSTQQGNDSVRITADPNHALNESNESNNTDTASIYLNGGSSSNNGGSYDSNGHYCSYGTYYQNGHYYCNSSNYNNGGSNYDSNGNYCSYGTYYQNGHYYCNSSNNSNYNGNHYDSNGNYCTFGTYYQNGRYYCSDAYGNNSNNNGGSYDSNGNYCSYGTYYQNGRYYCDSQYNNGNTNTSYDSNGNYCSLGTYYSNGRYYCN